MILSVGFPTAAIPAWAADATRAINQLIAKKLNAHATVAATYTLADDYDIIPVDTTSAAFTITLTSAANNKGRLVYFKRINAGANNATIDAAGAETIDGALTIAMTAQWETRALFSDGTNWLTL